MEADDSSGVTCSACAWDLADGLFGHCQAATEGSLRARAQLPRVAVCACLTLARGRRGIIACMDADALPPRWGEYAHRLPTSLDDLKGPPAGIVELPLHVGWSGRRVYDVGEEGQRLVLYALLLAEAQREDLERFLHRDSLVSMWPRLRRLLGPHARREWELRLMTSAYR